MKKALIIIGLIIMFSLFLLNDLRNAQVSFEKSDLGVPEIETGDIVNGITWQEVDPNEISQFIWFSVNEIHPDKFQVVIGDFESELMDFETIRNKLLTTFQ